MSLLDVLTKPAASGSHAARVYGVVTGVVTNIEDPRKLGRIKVKFPWLVDEDESHWARLVSPMAGGDRGLVFTPDVEDEVLVAFNHGDIRHPYIIGALWNGTDKPPSEKENDGENNLRIIKSRSGHLITLDDTSDSEKIEIIDKDGNNKITLDSAGKKIILEATGDIELKAADGKILLDGQTIEIHSSQEVKIKADSNLNAEASQTTTIKGSTVNIN